MSTVQLKVLTLNCWGVFVPIACKFKNQRMKAIAEELSKGEYDIVLLQEVWQQADYKLLCDRLVQVMPHCHYFHSGNYGSGVCIFSKYLIYDTSQYTYTLNGYPHRVFCGDWFGRKVVGLSKLLIGELKVHVYATHLHAQYYSVDDYEAHRLCQSFEMAQYIRQTSELCDLVIVAGDFNHCPDQLGYRVIRYCGNLDDASIAQVSARRQMDGEIVCGHEKTCNRADNSFHDSRDFSACGQTLDYIMFRQHSGHTVECSECYLTMRKVPGEAFNYSDHEGVAAVFDIKRNVTAMGKQRDHAEIEKTLTAVLPILDKGLLKVKSTRVFDTTIASLVLLLLLFLMNSEIICFLPRPAQFVCEAFLVFVCAFHTIRALLWADRELNGLLSVQKSIHISLRSLHVD